MSIFKFFPWFTNLRTNFRHGAVNKPASETRDEIPRENKMHIGDEVVAIGSGRRTKELNGSDIVRSHGRGGFDSLVNEGIKMTVQSINGYEVRTKYYTFDISDLRIVDAAETSPCVEPQTVHLDEGNYTKADLEAELLNF